MDQQHAARSSATPVRSVAAPGAIHPALRLCFTVEATPPSTEQLAREALRLQSAGDAVLWRERMLLAVFIGGALMAGLALGWLAPWAALLVGVASVVVYFANASSGLAIGWMVTAGAAGASASAVAVEWLMASAASPGPMMLAVAMAASAGMAAAVLACAAFNFVLGHLVIGEYVRLTEAARLLAGLDPAERNLAQQYCGASDLVAAYRDKVRREGRGLVRAELEAMRRVAEVLQVGAAA